MTIVIVRTSTHIVDLLTYNCQEVGLGKALAQKGHQVYIITPDRHEERIEISVNNAFPVIVYKVTYKALNRAYCWHNGVGKILEAIQPDIISINGFGSTMCLYYTWWCIRNQKKAVAIQGNYETTQKPFLKQLETLSNNTLGRYVLSHIQGVGCKTLWAGKFVKSIYPCDVEFTPIGLDVSKFVNYVQIDWKKKLGLFGKKVLLYVGIQESRRNPMFLLSIVDTLPSDYVLVMVGGGPQVEEVNQAIKKLCLEERVIQLGKLPQSQLPSLYKTADLFLLASSYEIFGMVILESMYFGLPVISSLTAGSDCLIENGVDGIIIEGFNRDQWVESIVEIMENPEQYKKMKMLAQSKIEEHFVWNKTVDNFLELYKKAMEL